MPVLNTPLQSLCDLHLIVAFLYEPMCLAGEAREYRYAGTETRGRMILFRDKTDVGGGGVRAGGGCPPPEGHRTKGGEGGAGQE